MDNKPSARDKPRQDTNDTADKQREIQREQDRKDAQQSGG